MSIFTLGFQKLTELLAKNNSISQDEQPYENDVSHEELNIAEDEETQVGILKVGAWTGLSSMVSQGAINRTVKNCKDLGLKRLDIIINDNSIDRSPTNFSTYETKSIVGLAKAVGAAGLDVHLMSWIMPHEKFIKQAADKLIPLMDECGAQSIQWDAEEPWTQARQNMPYKEAADLIAELFNGYTMGVNGIGYTPSDKFKPLSDICDYIVPQCYSTNTSGADPAAVVKSYVGRWKRLFGDKPMVVGLAAYRQNGIKGYSIDSALRAAFMGAELIEEIDEVIYWSLNQIVKTSAVAKTVKSLTSRKKLKA